MTTPPAGQDRFRAAVTAYDAGDLVHAENLSREILAANPDHPKALALLGLIAHHTGHPQPAIELVRRAIRLDPSVPAYHANLAAALLATGRVDEAVAAAGAALRLKPDFVEGLGNLAQALAAKNDVSGAIAAYQSVLRLRPHSVETLNNLGHALRVAGRLDEAAATLRRLLALAPDVPEPHVNLANTLRDQGKLDEAIAHYRRAVELRPNSASFGSNLLYALWFDPRLTASEMRRRLDEWNDRHATPLRDPRPFENSRDPDRRLRIGYVSPDFRDHVIGHYVEPLLANHDHARFEVVCYSAVTRPDATTARFQRYADAWRNIAGVADAHVAEQIRADRIDILVDLANHLADNRLGVFARKPAPVQITYLAHPASTGMAAMDYRLTDRYLEPAADPTSVEAPLSLGETYLAYPPPAETIDVQPPPWKDNGFVTFISPNAFAKLNQDVLKAWSRIMEATPRARLLVRLDGGAANNAHAPAWFRERGIDPARVEFIPVLPRADYLRLFHRADICLDPFPYAGYTTTLDAAWMGVPTVTLAGQTAVGRPGVSINSSLNLPALIASSVDDYVTIATALAADSTRVATLRSALRERMRRSPLLDHCSFARNVEAAYRRAWTRWAGKT